MQAITVKFHGPTNSHGSRYRAVAEAGSVTVSADPALNHMNNSAAVAAALCAKLGWTGPYAMGFTKGNAYVFVSVTPGTIVEMGGAVPDRAARALHRNRAGKRTAKRGAKKSTRRSKNRCGY